nr:MobQ family relaxase [Flavonifractor plautii]
MALFHLHVTQVKRSAGQSVVTSAAYRAGEKLYSEYYGEVSDYTHKGGVVCTDILLPPQAPNQYQDRATLWNAVEKAERGKKAQLAYSFDIALQNEFSLEENIALARQFVSEQLVGRGMIADFAIHQPDKEDGGIPNPHFHVLCPIRPIEPDGKWGCKQRRRYRLDEDGNRIIMVDRKLLKNPNGLILGTPGSGKSFSSKREITNVFLVTEDDVLVCDPEDEYAPLVKRLGGQVVKISPTSTQYVNPMDINLNYSDDDNPLALKVDFLLSFCDIVVGSKDGLQPVEKTVIDRCVRNVYRPYRLKLPGWEKAARLDSLGDGYTLEALLEIFAGQRTHTPGKKQAVQTMRPSVNLLVDIQAKLRAGKGAGYARWASKFNLKQMAQTLNYLNDHGLLDYKVLAEKTVAATARRNELSEKIKAAEKRMAEIAVLRTHIVNYAKTRDTYAAYRKAGYSPKFRSEHEADILLHQAAKQAFDQLNVKKLPKMKALQAEYAALLAEKKEAYAELRKARDEAQELLIVKANVDRILQNTERGGNAQEKGTVSFAANCALY